MADQVIRPAAESEGREVVEQLVRQPGAARSAPNGKAKRQPPKALAPAEHLQGMPAAGEGGFEVTGDFEARLQASRGSGSPLPAAARALMEPRLGADFGAVRVHADGEAARLSRSISAQAFTHGTDIYMGAGQYDPASGAGQRLLAHELSHVVQQTGAAVHRARRSATVPGDRPAVWGGILCRTAAQPGGRQSAATLKRACSCC